MSVPTERHFIQAFSIKANDLTPATPTPKFYGVSLPRGTIPKEEHGDMPLVYEEKTQALQAIKNYKGSRLKVFTNKDDAIYFASQPTEIICPSPSPLLASNANITESSPSEEKSSKFKSVTSQEMVKLRKAIERGDTAFFSETVWENPRYLINSGDGPTIMHEGFRYNALHVAARHKQAVMCSLVLNTVQDPKFFELLYDDDTVATRANRIHHVTDLYLNTPDKGFCETPLHFAAKFGCLGVLKVLLAHPLCDKTKISKYGLTAKEVICDRYPNCPPELKKEIDEVFEGFLYVPVLRDENNTAQPILGKPYSPQFLKYDYDFLNNSDKRDPSLSVKAYAGPMSPNMAREFYRIWKNPGSPLHKSKYTLHQKHLNDIRLSDTEKGLERVGRKLAADFGINWHEYWVALDAWVNLASPEGLKMLEQHLQKCSDEILKPLMTEDSKEFDKVPFNGNSNQTSRETKFSPPIYSLLKDKLCIHDKGKNCDPVTNDFDIQENDSNSKVTKFTNVELSHNDSGIDIQKDNDQDVKQHLFEIIIKDILENFCDFAAHLLSNSICTEKNVNLIFNKLIPIFKHVTQLNFSSESELYLIHYHLAVLLHVNLRAHYDEYNLVKLLNFLKTFLFSSSGDNILACDIIGQNTKEWQHLFCVLQYFYYHATNRLFDAKSCTCDLRHESNCDYYSASMCCNVIVKQQILQQVENIKRLSDVPTKARVPNDEDDCFYTPPESPVPGTNLDYFGQCDEAFITPISSACSSPKHGTEDKFEFFEVFVHGLEFTKDDIDMYRAVENLEINHEEYPHVFKWKNWVAAKLDLLAKCHSYMMQDEHTTPRFIDVNLNRHRSIKVANLRRNLF